MSDNVFVVYKHLYNYVVYNPFIQYRVVSTRARYTCSAHTLGVRPHPSLPPSLIQNLLITNISFYLHCVRPTKGLVMETSSTIVVVSKSDNKLRLFTIFIPQKSSSMSGFGQALHIYTIHKTPIQNFYVLGLVVCPIY